MSASYFNRKSVGTVDPEKLRELYFGANPGKVAERQQRQLEKQLEKGDRVVTQINRYDWSIQIVKGITDHARLQTEIGGKNIEILVFKEVCQTGLRPHLDICFPAHQEVQLTVGMLENLNEVVREARRLLNGETSSNYFNPKALR